MCVAYSPNRRVRAELWPKAQWDCSERKMLRENEQVCLEGETHGLLRENRSITNFSTKLQSRCFPINAGWRVLVQPAPPSLFYCLLLTGLDSLCTEAAFAASLLLTIEVTIQHCDFHASHTTITTPGSLHGCLPHQKRVF